MAQALYRKWRSQTFEEVVGQEHVTTTLRNALRDGRVAHAYLFSGPRGTGKTSTARILAKALNCTAAETERPCNACPTCIAINEGRMLDLIEIDAASNNSVDDIRELRDKVGFRPSEGRFKVYIIDEVHMLSTSAFNALLKTLEEPPPHARFVLATTEPHKIPATVISRCQRFDFRRIPAPEIAAHLRRIATEEGFQAEDAALMAIARSAQGCMRDAISLLDQMTSYGTDAITLAQVQQVLGSVSGEAVGQFVDAVAGQDAAQGLRLIQTLLHQGASLQEFANQVVEHLRGLLLVQMTGDASLLADQPPETVRQMQSQAQRMDRTRTLWAIKRFSEAVGELKGGFQPQLPLELALIEAIQGEPTVVQAVAVQAHQAGGAGPTAPAPQASPAKAKTPEKAPAPAEATADTPPLDEEAVRKLRDQWNNFLAAVKKRCGYKQEAALRAVRDIAIGENAVAFAFGNNQFARKLIAEPTNLAQVAGVLSHFVGRNVALECQDGDRASLSAAAGRTVHTSGDKGPDPLLAFAVEELGAEIVDSEG
ncbi:MAG: DNA polymerase III subunit gamma/tau [Caldilineae bacterium]|nr:MAG: DNA polymerase III subunit gamma/tau [Caldilineae bacterium]